MREAIRNEDVIFNGTLTYYRHPAGKPFSRETAIKISENWDTIDDIPRAFSKLVKKEAAESRKRKFAWDPEFGYLTPDPAWCGTGLAINCDVHLIGLDLLKNTNQTIDALYATRICCDSVSYMDIKDAGQLFSLENAASLGISDRDLVRRISSVLDGLATQETNARKKILKDCKSIFDDAIERSLALLKNARLLSKVEVLDMISPLVFAKTVDFIDGISLDFLHTMMFEFYDNAFDDENAPAEEIEFSDGVLADHIRSIFKNVKLNAAGRKFLR